MNNFDNDAFEVLRASQPALGGERWAAVELQIVLAARDLMEQNPALTYPSALNEVLISNSNLGREYRSELALALAQNATRLRGKTVQGSLGEGTTR